MLLSLIAQVNVKTGFMDLAMQTSKSALC